MNYRCAELKLTKANRTFHLGLPSEVAFQKPLEFQNGCTRHILPVQLLPRLGIFLELLTVAFLHYITVMLKRRQPGRGVHGPGEMA